MAVYFWGAAVASLFTDDAPALEVCGQVFRFLAPWYTTFIVGEVLAGAIRGAGETVRPMVITLVCTCLLRVVWMMAVVPFHWEVLWVATVYPLSWVLTGAVFVLYWRFGKWRERLYTGADDR